MAVVELLEDIPEHILVDGSVLCGVICSGADARVVHHTQDPLADASIHICPTCVRRWESIVDDIDRTETVRCAVDRAGDGDLWTCCDVVAADEARRLEHPDADQPVPACRDCYNWLVNFPANDVTTQYAQAAAWSE